MVERLQQSWEAGLTASQIANEIGTTRNAVIGKVHRLGLPGRVPRQRPERKAEAIRNTAITVAERVDMPRRPPSLSLSRVAKPHGTYELDELEMWMCRWPEGEHVILFCGRVREDGSPYCSEHRARAFVHYARKATSVHYAKRRR